MSLHSPNKRLIARLDIKGPNVIKGVRYEGLRIIGKPSELANHYYQSGTDEILYLDTVASLYGRNSLDHLITDAAANIHVPLTVGGGIRSVEDARKLFAAGADKVAINTALFSEPELLSELVDEFGSQSIIASIQARCLSENSWTCMTECGREKTSVDVISWFQKVQQQGAGEVFISSVDKDGTESEPDFALLEAIDRHARVPVIFSSGFATSSQVSRALSYKNITGVAIASALHSNKLDIADIKQKLNLADHKNCFKSDSEEQLLFSALANINIGIIDYGIGNITSIANALKKLGANVTISSSQQHLAVQDCLILPGVGQFTTAISKLRNTGLDSFIQQFASQGNAVVGICLGMQMLFSESSEGGISNGLDLIPGTVKSIKSIKGITDDAILPHIGWSYTRSKPHYDCQVLNSSMYYVHSYCAQDVPEECILNTCNFYGIDIIASVRRNNVAGMQFHPEKSGLQGLAYLGELIQSCLRITP